MASLAIPEDELWVNLSPYEKERVIPQSFGWTAMGSDLLAQDYMLKQLSASLLYPENETGRRFWEQVYKKGYQKYGSAQFPLNACNKVWIVPAEAEVYSSGGRAFVLKSHLKVLLDNDYFATQEATGRVLPVADKESGKAAASDAQNAESLAIFREVLLPEIEKEVNEGATFIKLRQIYNALILATWYKRNFEEALLNRNYSGQKKVSGIDVADKDVTKKIYRQYVAAFQRGVFHFIKEEYASHNNLTD